MFKKFLSVLLASLLIGLSLGGSTFASETNTPDNVTPYDSLIVLDLQFGVTSNLYRGNRPILTPNTVTVTSNITNQVYVNIQIRGENYLPLDSAYNVPPGQEVTLVIPPTFPRETYTITVTPLNPSIQTAPCAFTIDEGNAGENIEIVELTATAWSNVVTYPINKLFDEYVTVTNLVYSPGDVEIRIINATTTELLGAPQTLPPQTSITWEIPADLFNNDEYTVQARVGSDTVAGIHYLIVAPSVIPQ